MAQPPPQPRRLNCLIVGRSRISALPSGTCPGLLPDAMHRAIEATNSVALNGEAYAPPRPLCHRIRSLLNTRRVLRPRSMPRCRRSWRARAARTLKTAPLHSHQRPPATWNRLFAWTHANDTAIGWPCIIAGPACAIKLSSYLCSAAVTALLVTAQLLTTLLLTACETCTQARRQVAWRVCRNKQQRQAPALLHTLGHLLEAICLNQFLTAACGLQARQLWAVTEEQVAAAAAPGGFKP